MTTTDSEQAAQRLAASLVGARLAACAQVVGPVASTYWWQGAVEHAQEWQVLAKTTVDRYPALERHIRDQHSYDVPEIICTPIVAGSPDYLRWLTEETHPTAPPE